LGMIGGRQENEYADHFNRSVQAKRQPGSIFKPFIYLTALEQRYKSTTQLLNQPIQICLDEACKDRWNPQNHDGSTGGLTTLRDGLRKSLNLISVRIVQELVTPSDVKTNAHMMGISTYVPPYESIALGVSDVIPLEIASSYSAFSYNGILTTPMAITQIEDRYGRVIKKYEPILQEVKNESLIYLTRDLMRSVVDSGTGGSLRWKYKFNQPAAGKTGTTDSKTDAWFAGFTPHLTMVVWIGVDDPAISLGEKQYGSQAALPIWGRSIKEIYDEKGYPTEDWEKPDGIIEIEICKDSFENVSKWCPKSSRMKEIFLDNAKPGRECTVHPNPFSRTIDG